MMKCYVWLTIFLALALLAASPQSPPLSPPLGGMKGGVGGKLALAASSFAPRLCWGAGGPGSRGARERGRIHPCTLRPCALAPWVELAQQDPTVRIEPVESTVRAGQSFTVSVMIAEASNLGGFEFTLLFVTTTVTVNSVTVGDFPGSTGRTVLPVVGPIIDNQAGQASFGVVTVGSAPGPGGTGVLATITLTAQGPGESPLNLRDVLVVDTRAQLKTTTVEGGVVSVGFGIYLPLILKEWQNEGGEVRWVPR
ncbi:MAG: hypothetical protein FJ014_15280 [Chloroflexi bacterium]|nr:hypothetical protein [Chloroflexota bacterium]